MNMIRKGQIRWIPVATSPAKSSSSITSSVRRGGDTQPARRSLRVIFVDATLPRIVSTARVKLQQNPVAPRLFQLKVFVPFAATGDV